MMVVDYTLDRSLSSTGKAELKFKGDGTKEVAVNTGGIKRKEDAEKCECIFVYSHTHS